MKFLIVLALIGAAAANTRPFFPDGYEANVNAIMRPSPLPAQPVDTGDMSLASKPIIRPVEEGNMGVASRPIIRPVPAPEMQAEQKPLVQIIVNVAKAEDVDMPAVIPEEIVDVDHRPSVNPEEIGHRPAIIPEEIGHRPSVNPEEIGHRPAVVPEEIGHRPAQPESIMHRPAPVVGDFMARPLIY